MHSMRSSQGSIVISTLVCTVVQYASVVWPSITTHRKGDKKVIKFCHLWQASDKAEFCHRYVQRSESVIKVTKIFHTCAFTPPYHLSHIGPDTIFLCHSSLSPLLMGRNRGPDPYLSRTTRELRVNHDKCIGQNSHRFVSHFFHELWFLIVRQLVVKIMNHQKNFLEKISGLNILQSWIATSV